MLLYILAGLRLCRDCACVLVALDLGHALSQWYRQLSVAAYVALLLTC
jgi:hypothetical protein